MNIICTTEVITVIGNGAAISPRKIITITEIISVTEQNAIISPRKVVTITEAISVAEPNAVINRGRNTLSPTEVISFTTTPVDIDFPELLVSSFTASESMTFGLTPPPLVDVFNMGDSHELSTTTYLTSIVQLVESFGSISQTTSLQDTVELSDAQYISFVAYLTDSLTVVDSHELSILANLVSQINLGESITNTLIATTSLIDTFTVGDLHTLGFAELLVSTGLFSSSIIDLNTQIELLTDSLTITDVRVLSATVSENLTGSITLNDTISFGSSTYNVVLVSTLEMGSLLWAPDFGAIAWVMNTEGESIVPYTNFGFHSIAEHKGRVFAASTAGIYELTGDTDNGRKISAHVKHGFNDFDIPQRKRAADLYISYTGGDLECSIETYDGPKSVYNYLCEEREADAPRNNRMKVGKGLVSRYWRMEIHNLEGAAFKMYEIGLDMVTTKRRL
jgi:hypothetical protein